MGEGREWREREARGVEGGGGEQRRGVKEGRGDWEGRGGGESGQRKREKETRRSKGWIGMREGKEGVE